MPKIPDCAHEERVNLSLSLICSQPPLSLLFMLMVSRAHREADRARDRCLDFRPDPNFTEEEQWSPEGYSWYDDELIPNRPSRYTSEEQLEILDTHPFFTGVCPQCRHKFEQDNLPVHFDCPNCGWIDDSV